MKSEKEVQEEGKRLIEQLEKLEGGVAKRGLENRLAALAWVLQIERAPKALTYTEKQLGFLEGLW